MQAKTIYGFGLKSDLELESLHPCITVRTSGWITTKLGEIHYSGRRATTVREAIELECRANRRDRPSVERRYDARTLPTKCGEWVGLWFRSPRDAARLPFIDRHPPMVWWDYDDSDDWASKRWARALMASHRAK